MAVSRNYLKLVIVFLFIPSFCIANRLEYYEPKQVQLAGVINIIVSPGPPNYESIKNGNTSETGYYLILDNPIDVDLLPNKRIALNENDEPEKNIYVLQLAITKKVYGQK